MDMQVIAVYIFVIANFCFISEAQQFYQNQMNVANKPAQNEFDRLKEIPFQNALRALSTPPRDFVPIQESQQDVPPPPRPSQASPQVQNQPVYNYNTYTQPQLETHSNAVPYNTHFPVQQAPNTPMSFQYVMMNDFPKEIYNFLYHTRTESNEYPKANNEYTQTINGYTQANNNYYQGSNGYSQVSNGYSEANKDNNKYFQRNNYIQQTQTYPNVKSEYQTPVTYVPVMNNNNVVTSQGINSIAVYNNYQSPSGYNNFKPSVPFGQNNVIDVSSYQNHINYIPSHRFRNEKASPLVIPPNNNVQYLSSTRGTNSFVPSTMYVPQRSPRMTSYEKSRSYLINSKFVPGEITYVTLM